MSVFHSGQVAMSAHRSKKASAGTSVVISALAIVFMRLVCALTTSPSTRDRQAYRLRAVSQPGSSDAGRKAGPT